MRKFEFSKSWYDDIFQWGINPDRYYVEDLVDYLIVVGKNDLEVFQKFKNWYKEAFGKQLKFINPE